jgi:D-alanyl-D-alanine carboxypeptidase
MTRSRAVHGAILCVESGDPILRHLPPDLLRGLHVTNGLDRTHEITVRHLISNTSGLT